MKESQEDLKQHVVFGCPNSLKTLLVTKMCKLEHRVSCNYYMGKSAFENSDLNNLSHEASGPLLECEHGQISSSNAICKFLIEISETECGSLLSGKTLIEKAQVCQWLCNFENMQKLIAQLRQNLNTNNKAQPQALFTELFTINKHLKNRDYMVGNSYTLADLELVGLLYGPRGSPLVESLPKKFSEVWKLYDNLTQSSLFEELQGKSLNSKN